MTQARQVVAFRVAGQATTKGSMKAAPRGKSVVMWEDTHGSKEWRSTVAWGARAALRGRPACAAPVIVHLYIYLTRPKSVRVPFPVGAKTGDSDKLARNVLDALQDAGVFVNDSQVVDLHVVKRWANPWPATTPEPWAEITVTELVIEGGK